VPNSDGLVSEFPLTAARVPLGNAFLYLGLSCPAFFGQGREPDVSGSPLQLAGLLGRMPTWSLTLRAGLALLGEKADVNPEDRTTFLRGFRLRDYCPDSPHTIRFATARINSHADVRVPRATSPFG